MSVINKKNFFDEDRLEISFKIFDTVKKLFFLKKTIFFIRIKIILFAKMI